MGTQGRDLNSLIPDLRDFSLDQLAKLGDTELGDSVLARSIAQYRKRLKESGVPLSSFQARI